jgi:TetR/AcrR family transcriptional regulator
MVESATGTAVRSRKADILRAAEREFATAGYGGARIERIAAAAGVNKQLLFHYYRSKEGLFAAAVSAMLGRFDIDGDRTEMPASALKSAITDLMAGLRAVPGVVGIVAGARSDAEFPPMVAAMVRAWRDRLLGRLRSAVAEGQKRGYFRDDLDPHTVGALASAAAFGLMALELETTLSDSPGHDGSAQVLAQLLADLCAWR